jgi:hypothetical protein
MFLDYTIDNGGSRFSFSSGWAGSQILAQILYSVQGIFDYQTDNDGNTFIDNKGSSNTTNDLLLYSGRGIELTGTQSVDIPIHYTLGEELVTGGEFDYDTSELASNGWYSYNSFLSVVSGRLVVADNGGWSSGYQVYSVTQGKSYKIETNVTSGTTTTAVIRVFEGASFHEGNGDILELTIPANTSGDFSDIFTATSNNIIVALASNSTQSSSFDNVSVREITTENSFLTYQDLTAKEIVTLGNSVDGGSSKKLVTNGAFDSDLSGWVAYNAVISRTVEGYIKIDDSANAGTGSSANQLIETVSGKKYVVKGTCLIDDTTSYLQIGTAIGLFNIANPKISLGDFTFIFTATTSSTSIGLATSGTGIAYFDNISVTEILPVSTHYTFSNTTVNNILTHTTNWSEADRAKIAANPNLIGKLALSETGTIDELDMELVEGDGWYPAMEKSGAYLVDARAGYGTELVNDTSLQIGTEWNKGGSGSAVFSSSGLSLTGDVILYKNGTIDNKTYVLEITVDSFTGSSLYVFAGFVSRKTITSAGTYSFIIKNNTNPDWLGIGMDTAGDTATVSYFSVREATAEEIANYTSTIRTNADFQSSGLQTTAFIKDALNVPLSYDDTALNWDGGSYGDAQFMPPSDSAWEIDTVMYCKNDGTHKWNGIFSTNNNRYLIIGQLTTGQITLYIGNKQVVSSVVSDGFHHIRVEFDGQGNGKLVIDNNNSFSYASSSYEYSLFESFFVGSLSRAKANYTALEFKTPSGYFQYVNRERTAEERTADYAKAKLQHPTLP